MAHAFVRHFPPGEARQRRELHLGDAKLHSKDQSFFCEMRGSNKGKKEQGG